MLICCSLYIVFRYKDWTSQLEGNCSGLNQESFRAGTDPKDLEAIENRIIEDEEYDEEAIQDEGYNTEEEDEPMDEEDEETYDPNDF